ncbi:MAG: gamma-glutamylcyclotransferase [Bdellovibrionaceae bacterium]|nr:gamma-glutamylcyclotransferase [Pseudobdellovibrionaceae bacterium]
MDAHYHKVMDRRKAIKDTGTRLYFAYSGVLDRDAFNTWIEEHSYQFFQLPDGDVAEAKDVDLIFDFPSRWWGGRVAGLMNKPGASVFGRLFEIPAVDWPIVQHKEGVVTGMSIEYTLKVTVDGKEIEATAFVTNPARASLEGPVSERFIQALINGAKQAGLPDHYIHQLPAKAASA